MATKEEYLQALQNQAENCRANPDKVDAIIQWVTEELYQRFNSTPLSSLELAQIRRHAIRTVQENQKLTSDFTPQTAIQDLQRIQHNVIFRPEFEVLNQFTCFYGINLLNLPYFNDPKKDLQIDQYVGKVIQSAREQMHHPFLDHT